MNEEIKEQTIRCPVCNTTLMASAKFCSECGTRLGMMALEPTWIAAMHERINHAKDNHIFYTIFAIIGALAAILIPFVLHFILQFTMDPVSWTLTILGVVFIFAGYGGILYEENRMKKLIQQLEEGPINNEEPGEEG